MASGSERARRDQHHGLPRDPGEPGERVLRRVAIHAAVGDPVEAVRVSEAECGDEHAAQDTQDEVFLSHADR